MVTCCFSNSRTLLSSLAIVCRIVWTYGGSSGELKTSVVLWSSPLLGPPDLTFWKNSSSGLPSRAVPGCTTSATRTSSSSSELFSPCQGRSHWHHRLAAVVAPQEPRASGIFLPGHQPPIPDPKPGVLNPRAPARPRLLLPARPPDPSFSPAAAHGSCRAWRPERPVPGPEPQGPQGSKFGSPAPLSHLTPPSSPCAPQHPHEPPKAPPLSPPTVAGKNPTIGAPQSSTGWNSLLFPPSCSRSGSPAPRWMVPSMRTRSCLFLAGGRGGGRKQLQPNGSEAAWIGSPSSAPPPLYRNIAYWN